MQSEESRRKVIYTYRKNEQHWLMFAQRENDRTNVDEPGRDKRKCDYCMETGHTREKCWKLSGRPNRGCGGRVGPQDLKLTFLRLLIIRRNLLMMKRTPKSLSMEDLQILRPLMT